MKNIRKKAPGRQSFRVKLSEDSFKKKQNTEIARAQLGIREKVSELSEELKAKLFTEVRDKLERYMDTREYQDYLVAEIRKAKQFAGDEEVLIYIDPGRFRQAELSCLHDQHNG